MKLTQYLFVKQITVADLARLCELPQPTVWRIASGKVTPSPKNALRIEQATGGAVTRDELLFPELYASSQSQSPRIVEPPATDQEAA